MKLARLARARVLLDFFTDFEKKNPTVLQTKVNDNKVEPEGVCVTDVPVIRVLMVCIK